MTTMEREHERHRSPHDSPVFLASDGRRARRLRLVASGSAVLALLWLVALAAGMLGFGRLPGISTPVGRIGGPDKAQSQRSESDVQAPVRPTQRPTELVVDSERSGRVAAQTPSGRARASVRRAQVKPVSRRPQAPPPGAVQPVQPQPALPPPPQQGWARHSRPAPPGYTRRTTEPQPAPPPGQAIAPGQVKKALQPAPAPPPPPPGNGGGPKKS
jgi:hypothetical protein